MALKVGELFASFGIDTSGVDKTLQDIGSKFDSIGGSMMKSGAIMSAAVTTPIVNMGKAMYNVGTSFDAQMSRVEAISGATAEEFSALRDLAIEMGSTTSFTASEAGKALEYMGMAGWDADQMMEGLAPIMDLAAASGEDLGVVSDIVTDALTAFGLGAEDAGMFADVLAAAATNANTNVGMMGETFKYVAPLAGAMGYSVKDMGVAIGIMANSGIKGSQAGTALRNIITNLAKPTDAVTEAMEELGINLSDTEGKALPLNDVIGQLRESFVGMTEEQKAQYAATIAGKYGMSGLLSLVNASDEEFEKLSSAIQNSTGATREMAEIMLDNAAGAVTILKSAMEGLGITLWDLVKEPFKGVILGLTDMVDAFRNMDSAMQMGILKTAAFSAAIGPAMVGLGGMVKILPKLSKALKLVNSPLGFMGIGLLAIGAAAMDADNSIGRTFESMAKTVAKKAGEISGTLNENYDVMQDRVKNFLGSVSASINTALPALLDAGAGVVTFVADSITKNIGPISQIGKDIVSAIAGSIIGNASTLVPSIVNLMSSLAGAMIDNASFIFDAAVNALWEIGKAVAAVDWIGIATDLWGKLANALESAKGTLLDFSALIADTLSGSDWTALADKLWGFLETALDDMLALATSWDGASLAGNIIDILVSAIDGITTIGSRIVGKIGEKLGSESFQDSLKDMGKIAGAIIDKIVDGISSSAGNIGNIVTKIGDVLNGEGFAATLQTLTGIATEIISKIVAGFGTGAEAASMIVTKISEVLTGSGVTNIISSLTTIAGEIIKGIVAGIGAAGNLVADVCGKISEMLVGATGNGLIANLGNIAVMVIDGVVAGISTLGDVASKIITSISTKLTSGNISDTFETLTGIAQKIIDAVVRGIPNVTDAITNVVTAIGTLLDSDTVSATISGLSGIAKAVIQGVVDGIPLVTTAITDIVGKLSEILGGDNAGATIGALTGIAKAIIQGITDAIPGLLENAKGILTAVSNLFVGLDWSQIGADLGGLATALIDGLTEAIGGFGEEKDSIVKNIFTAISGLFNGINWESVGDSLGGLATAVVDGISEGLTTLASSGVIPGLITAAGKIIVGLAKGLTDPENLMKIGLSAMAIVGQIGTSILGPGIKTLFNIGGAIGTALCDGIRSLFGVKVDKVTEQMQHKFMDMQFDLSETCAAIGETCGADLMYRMGEALTSTEQLNAALAGWDTVVQNGFAPYFKEFEYLGDQSVVSLYQAMISGIENTGDVETASAAAAILIAAGYQENLLTGLAATGGPVYDALANTFYSEDIVLIKDLAAQTGLDIGTMFGSALPEGFEVAIQDGEVLILDMTSGMMDDVSGSVVAKGDSFQQAVASVWNDTFDKVIGDVGSKTDELKEMLRETGIEAGTLMGLTLPEGVAEGLKAGTVSVEEARDAIIAAASVASGEVAAANAENLESGKEAGEAVGQGMDESKPTVETAAGDVETAITEQFGPLPEELSETAKASMTGLETAIKEGKDPIEQAALSVADGGANAFLITMSEANGKAIGTGWVNAVKAGLEEMASVLFTTASTVAGDVFAAFSSELSFMKGESVGLNISEGIAAGIRSGSGVIEAAARTAAMAALRAAKYALDIRSPSHVAEDEIGAMFDKGIARGILYGANEITRATESMTAQMRGALTVDANAFDRGTERGRTTDITGILSRLDSMIDNQGAKYVVVLDSGVMVGEMAPLLDERLSEMTDWKAGGRA